MSTRVETGGPATGVSSAPTASRVTPPPARPFKQVMDAGAHAVVSGAESAVRRLPGGPVLAAAFRPGPGGAGASSATSAEGPTGTSSSALEGGSGAPGAGGADGGVEGALQNSSDMNLYYLELQERISAESRQYTALSNVLKARHDTVKNAIGNIR
jgi:hypothetical protein